MVGTCSHCCSHWTLIKKIEKIHPVDPKISQFGNLAAKNASFDTFWNFRGEKKCNVFNYHKLLTVRMTTESCCGPVRQFLPNSPKFSCDHFFGVLFFCFLFFLAPYFLCITISSVPLWLGPVVTIPIVSCFLLDNGVVSCNETEQEPSFQHFKSSNLFIS